MIYHSRTARAFFTPAIHGAAMPEDVVAITEAEHAALLLGQSQGAEIVAGPGGVPQLQFPVPPTAAEVLEGWRANTSVTAYQAKAALFNRGLLDDAEAVAQGAGGLVLLAWQTATNFQRNAASIAALAPAIGITTPEDLDDLFREAAAITA